LEGQLRECYGRVAYSHKTHEKCADILLERLSRIKMTQIVLSALTTGGFLGNLFGAMPWVSAVGTVLSGCLLVLNAYTKDKDMGEVAQKHKQAANDIWLIREKYLSLLTDLAAGSKGLAALQEDRDKLLNELHQVYGGSPSTNYPAYRRAQMALQQNEELTFSDAEIDAFLPRELRRTS
jgi:hypothetical protein